MQELLNQASQLLETTSGQVFIVVFITAVVHFFAKRLLRVLLRTAQATSSQFDDAFVEALRAPLLYFVWLYGLSMAIDLVNQNNEIPIFDFSTAFEQVGVIALLAWAVVRLIGAFELLYCHKVSLRDQAEAGVDESTVAAVAKLLRVAVIITGALIIMQSLGYSVSGVLAFGGVGGIAVGFAAQDLLSNFFGALMIHLDRPFSVGDWIRSPDKDIEGTVEHIGWRVTRIRTFDMRPLYVPNSTFTKISVENPSRMLNRRIYETIGIRYDDAAVVEKIINDVKAMLVEHQDIDNDRTLMVNFNAFGASSLDFFIYCFTKTTVWTEYHSIKQDVLLKVYALIEAHGADIAYPTQRISIEQTLVSE